MSRPVTAVVMSTPTVESVSPWPTTGSMSRCFVSMPPEKSMTESDNMPMSCASSWLLNSSPSPSVPKSMPVKRKRSKVGMPKR